MPPKKIIKLEKHLALNDNYSEDSEEDQKPRKSAKNKNRRPPIVEPSSEYSDDEINDNYDVYNDDNRAYMKIANEIVTKNAKLPALFDPNISPGLTALINKTRKVSGASQVLVASAKIYGKRVDVVHTEARNLDQEVTTRIVEDVKRKKEPFETNEEDLLNESLNDLGSGDARGFFSEEYEANVTQKKQKKKESKAMNADMTMANFDFDGTISMASALPSNSDTSFQFDDDNLRRKFMTIAKDRTVLMGKEKRSAKEVEERLKRANTAAMELFRKELLKRGGNKGGKKEASDEKDTANNYSYFHNSYYQYAMNKKREKRHVCIDDVAATSEDHSRVYMHNEWYDKEDDARATAENAEEKMMDDGDFIHFSDIYSAQQEDEEDNEDGDDILDGVLEQFQGTLELATANTHKLEDGWIETLGLQKKDLRPSNKTDVSFEQTANDDFDPDKRLV
uniref:Condensin complex subunit 2 n=1 Tax=Panagrolaimus sp. PS1159 TaxID=55785 RepID=A0AC35GII5_9BILA